MAKKPTKAEKVCEEVSMGHEWQVVGVENGYIRWACSCGAVKKTWYGGE